MEFRYLILTLNKYLTMGQINMSQPDPNMILIKHRLRYITDHRKQLSLILLGTILLICLLLAFMVVQFSTRIKPLHFELTDNMQIFEPVPLDKEGITKPAMLNWINNIVNLMFSFNYSNVSAQRSKLIEFLGDNALQAYTDLLVYDEDFNKIAERKYVVSVIPTATPEILTSKDFKGRYAWQIRIPARLVFSNATMREEQEMILDFLVWRVTESESPMGILIANFSRKVTGRYGGQVVQ